MTKRKCCSSSINFHIYKKVINRRTQRKRGRQIQYDRDRTLPTPISFSMLDCQIIGDFVSTLPLPLHLLYSTSTLLYSLNSSEPILKTQTIQSSPVSVISSPSDVFLIHCGTSK